MRISVFLGKVIIAVAKNVIQSLKTEAASISETSVTIIRREVISDKMRVFKSKLLF
jgi:hypothetical protein